MLFGKIDHFAKGAGADPASFFFDFFNRLRFNGFGFLLALLEFFDAAKSVNVFHFTRKERVAFVANVDFDFRHSCSGHEGVAAGTTYLAVVKILRMYTFFHCRVFYQKPGSVSMKLFLLDLKLPRGVLFPSYGREIVAEKSNPRN